MTAHFETADVHRAAAGDHAAFERLYRDHMGRIFALCVRMVDEQSAEDLTQEVFIRAWSRLGTFKGQSQFGTCLHRLAVNHILSRRETQRKREARHSGDSLLARVMTPTRRSSEGLVGRYCGHHPRAVAHSAGRHEGDRVSDQPPV
ncbi:MAG: sigma-70 family RNA polymerase sigma factor [Longimicrobiales bacterium]|nr:sigma-70 family RNA polymerase sigma factor [Longimicrobiales bacterium]